MVVCRRTLTPTPLPQAGEGLHGSERRTAFSRLRGKVPEGRMGASCWPIEPAVPTLLGTTPCKVERKAGTVARGPQSSGAARRSAQSSGGWQESRTIRCGRTLAVGSCGALSGWISMAAAVRPVSRVWRRTEVSGGHRREASELSS